MNKTHITLNTNAKMPIIGLGTWKSPAGKVGAAVEYALVESGYRQVDCAAIYLNEQEIGNAFSKVFGSGQILRPDVFVTSKLWNTAHQKNAVEIACKKTLADLQLDYLDLYLMHWGVAEPANVPVRETWEAMEQLVRSGLVKAIGVANFTGPMLVDLLTCANIKPAVNQIELHPYNQQTHLVDFCKRQGVAVTAYSPLGTPGNAVKNSKNPVLLKDEKINQIARRHKKTAAQILIRWAIERETVVIPKSVSPENIKANIDVFDFSLTTEDRQEIATLDRKHRFVDPWEWWQIPYFD